MKTIISTFITAMLLTSIHAGATNQGSVNGRVVDARTHEAIGYASVTLSESKISNVTNSEGTFMINLPVENTNDTLVISTIGYEPQKVAVNDIKRDFTIRMQPSSPKESMSLGEALYNIKVRPDEASFLVKMAFSKVQENYCTKGNHLTAFYRESIKREDDCIALNEAVLNINKSPYCSANNDKIGIYKARGSRDRSGADSVMVKFQGGANAALNIDVVKNPFLGCDIKEIDDIYRFRFAQPVTMDNKFLFVIEFDQREDIKDSYYRGRIFIDYDTYAIARVEFTKNINKFNSSAGLVKSKPSSMKLDVKYATYVVNYKEVDGKWYFDHSRSEVKFHASSKKRGFDNSYVLCSEIAVNKMDNLAANVTQSNKLRSVDFIAERVADFRDPEFWKDYNIILPDNSLNTIINKLAMK